ncbi:AAA family ATPase [Janthinobacterium sp. DSP2-3-3]|uniref:AAA family ATPase n=1 Tax=Janthinobacterium sp. DSP2-3-3 TaxID=2804596 RepID=UPI003CE6808D
MLIEFSVSNFRSIRGRQTLSMVATPRLRKKNCVFKIDVKGEQLPDLLKVAAIYGPNASGKSNLLAAIEVVQKMTNFIPSSESRELPVSPFRFDEALLDEPSEFEFHFVVERQRYQFNLGLNSKRITLERLITYPSGKETLLYERVNSPVGDVYKLGESLEGGESLHDVWKNLTGPQTLFISQAVANSNENLMQLRIPRKWLSSGFITVVEDEMEHWSKVVQAYGAQRPFIANDVANFLQDVDVPITNIVFESLFEDGREHKEEAPSKKPMHLDILMKPGTRRRTTLTHTTALGRADFDFSEESRGTRNLLGFFMPWVFLGKKAIVVDELDSSLHPKIVSTLVEKHLNNSVSSQLIFTTHDTHLMDSKLLRRDQFWLTERDKNGATILRSIHDFEGREGEDIEKRYYEGKYRGLPILRSL